MLFDGGLDIFTTFISIANINVVDIATYLQANPRRCRRFVQWMKQENTGTRIVRALMSAYTERQDVTSNDRKQVLIAVYVVAQQKCFKHVMYQLSRISGYQEYHDLHNIRLKTVPVFFYRAFCNDNLHLIKYCLTLPIPCLYNDGYNALLTACQYGDLDAVRLLVTLPCVDINSQRDMSFKTIDRFGYLSTAIDMYQVLGIQAFNHAVCCASSNGHVAILQYLAALIIGDQVRKLAPYLANVTKNDDVKAFWIAYIADLDASL